MLRHLQAGWVTRAAPAVASGPFTLFLCRSQHCSHPEKAVLVFSQICWDFSSYFFSRVSASEWERKELKRRKNPEVARDLAAGTGRGGSTGVGAETGTGGGQWSLTRVNIISFLIFPPPGPDLETVEIVKRRLRGASRLCTGMCRPPGSSTSLPCSTRACSSQVRSRPPSCPTRPRPPSRWWAAPSPDKPGGFTLEIFHSASPSRK